MNLLDLGQVFSGDFYCLNDNRIYNTDDVYNKIKNLRDVFIDHLDTHNYLLAVGLANSSFDYFKNSMSSSVKSSVQNYKAGQVYKNNKGGTLTVDYVGPRAINYHFDGENKGANQATFTQFEAVLDANGFTAIKSAFPGENPRDEYLRMQGRNMRENQVTLTQGEFDNAMDNNKYFMRGFYKWGPDSHNWSCEVDINLYLIVSYATDGGGVHIYLIDTSNGKKEMVDERYIHFLNYDDVVQECLNIGESIGEDFTEFFE